MPAEKSVLKYDLKDPSFSVNNSRDYQLVSVLSDSALILLVYNPNTNKYLSLKSWEIHGLKMFRNPGQFVENIPELNLPFKRKILSVNTSSFTIVPQEFFSEELAEKYYRLNYETRPGEVVKSELIKNLNARLVYALNLNYELIDRYFNPDLITHSANAYLVSLLSDIENYLSRKMFVDIEKNFIRVAILLEGKLQIYNSFSYKTNEDILYHLANLSAEFGFDHDRDKYYLSGIILKDSELYKIIFRYFRYPLLLPRPANFLYPPVFDQFPSQLFYNAFTALLCE